MKILSLLGVVGLALFGFGCEVSDQIVGQAVECGLEAADSVAGDWIIPDESEITRDATASD
jgi:hypothetical protein